MLGQALALGAVGCGAVLALRAPGAYYRLVQEDELLEWSTAWAFVLAAALHVALARRLRRGRGASPASRWWFPAALAAGCAFVALEEVSWGQRILGFRPPEYFLDNNYQQELNAHNLLSGTLRKLALAAILGGYGVVLPSAAARPRLRRWMVRLGLLPPPAELVPLFAVALALQLGYPVRFTGEWVELLLGVGLLLSALLRLAPAWRRGRFGIACLPAVLLAMLLVVGAGAASAAGSRLLRAPDPAAVAAARLELEALARDLRDVALPDRDHGHRRVHTFATFLDWEPDLQRGAHRELTGRGLPEARARYVLDPWNGSWWLRYERTEDRRRLLVYSLGPNRLRETVGWDVGGDDLGVVVEGPP